MKLRLTAHLFAGGPQPIEWLSFYLRTRVYHCSPEELERMDLDTILTDLTCLDVEAKVNKMNSRMR